MEKEERYNYRDNLLNTRKITPLENGTIKPRPKPTVTSSFPNIGTIKYTPGTGIVPEIMPTKELTLSKPYTANTPIILAPNIDGGLKTDNPSIIHKIASTLGMPIIKTAPPIEANIKTSVSNNPRNKEASFVLPNMWIMVAMVVGIIVMVIISKRKK